MLSEAFERVGAHRHRVSWCPNKLGNVPLRRCRTVNYGTRTSTERNILSLLASDAGWEQDAEDVGSREASRQGDTHGALRWRWPPV